MTWPTPGTPYAGSLDRGCSRGKDGRPRTGDVHRRACFATASGETRYDRLRLRNPDRPSPTRLNAIPTTVIARPGKVGSHHAVITYSRESAIIAPHSGVGGCTPRPRKLSEAPARMFSTAADIAKTTAGPMTLGSRCRTMTRRSLQPRS